MTDALTIEVGDPIVVIEVAGVLPPIEMRGAADLEPVLRRIDALEAALAAKIDAINVGELVIETPDPAQAARIAELEAQLAALEAAPVATSGYLQEIADPTPEHEHVSQAYDWSQPPADLGPPVEPEAPVVIISTYAAQVTAAINDAYDARLYGAYPPGRIEELRAAMDVITPLKADGIELTPEQQVAYDAYYAYEPLRAQLQLVRDAKLRAVSDAAAAGDLDAIRDVEAHVESGWEGAT